MDPTTCYSEMKQAMQIGDYAAAQEYAESLQAWLQRGGFYPTASTKAEVDATLLRVWQQVAERSGQ